MFKHLSEKTLSIFLLFINKIWFSHELPKYWKHSVVIPIHKTGKNPSDPVSYTPISPESPQIFYYIKNHLHMIAYFHIYLEIPFFAVNHVSITYQMLFGSL
jgi:hypothetical protein